MTDVRDQTKADEALLGEVEAFALTPSNAPAIADGGAVARARGQAELEGFLERPQLDTLPYRPKRRVRWGIILSLIFVVLLPTAVAGVYLFAYASDEYVAETRFAVRKSELPGTPDEENSSPAALTTGSLLAGGANLVSEDAEVVASYLHSRAAIADVSKLVDIRAIYDRPEADFLSRLPAHASAEELNAYWKRMVRVYVEASSGIVSVSVSAFRREDALALNKAILQSAEKLANSLTLKMRADQIKLADDEVRRAQAGVQTALTNLTNFRNSERLINPVENSQSTGKLLFDLMSDRITTEAQLFVMQQSQGLNAPGINGLKARVQSIAQNIAQLQDQLAGDKGAAKNMAATLSKFEELEIKKEFAEKLFDFSRQGLERAQLASLNQSIYLAVFVPPSLPQDYTYPNRYADLALVLLAAVMTWVSGATITASVLDHRL